MPFIDTLDDLGIRYVVRPMSFLARLHLLNTFDDIGISLVCRPLRYLHRFAAFLLDSELYPIITYSDVACLKADESIVSSMSRCSTSLASGGGGGSRVSSGGSRGSTVRIKKRSRESTKASRSSIGREILTSRGSFDTAAIIGKRRINGHA